MTIPELRERIARALAATESGWDHYDDFGRNIFLQYADAALAEIAAAGLVLVPGEPTGEMLSAGFDARHGFEAAIYRAMLAKSPYAMLSVAPK